MISSNRKITYLTSGAAGMFCGSCMHDNTLVRALIEIGCDVSLVPTYTPIRTDETNVSVDQVFFGGINVYLQQKIPVFRWLPGFMDRFLNNPRLIRRATAKSIEMKPQFLGKLAISMLKGDHGNQRKEVKRLAQWLKNKEQPDLLVLTNLLIGGFIPYLKRELNVPIIVTLQGDDVFLDSLPGEHRAKCIQLMRKVADHVDAFVTHTDFYREYMADYLGIDKNKIHITPLGLDTSEFETLNREDKRNSREDGGVATIGYLARLAPEKGFHVLVDAYIDYTQRFPDRKSRLLIAGWLSDDNQEYAEQQLEKLRVAGLEDRFEHWGSIDRQKKLLFLEQVDVMCVPTVFLEPKGLYALEAMASGVPVIAPDHGAFPEMIADTAGGLLFPAGKVASLADAIHELLHNHGLRRQLAESGRQAVLETRNAQTMARDTLLLMEKFL